MTVNGCRLEPTRWCIGLVTSSSSEMVSVSSVTNLFDLITHMHVYHFLQHILSNATSLLHLLHIASLKRHAALD